MYVNRTFRKSFELVDFADTPDTRNSCEMRDSIEPTGKENEKDTKKITQSCTELENWNLKSVK